MMHPTAYSLRDLAAAAEDIDFGTYIALHHIPPGRRTREQQAQILRYDVTRRLEIPDCTARDVDDYIELQTLRSPSDILFARGWPILPAPHMLPPDEEVAA